MIQEQVPSGNNYQPSRVSFYNIDSKRTEPSLDSLRLELSNPQSKLLYIAYSGPNRPLIPIDFGH